MWSSDRETSVKLTMNIAVVACLLTGATAWGADFDGSKPLICAPVEVNECAAGDACQRTTPREAGAPTFIRIDFQRKAVIGPKRTAAIQLMETSETQLLLMGVELGFGWTLALDQESGDMAATLADREGVFVFFGSCTPL